MVILDLRTVILMAALSCLLLSIVLAGAYRVYPRSIGGLREWSLGGLGFCVAGILFTLRGVIPEWLGIVLANTVFAASYVLSWRGMRAFHGLRQSSWMLWSSLLAALVVFLGYFTFIVPDVVPRLIVVSGVSVVFYGSMALLSWRHNGSGMAERFFLALMVLGTLSSTLRMVTAVLHPASATSLLAPSGPQVVYLIAHNMLALLNGIGFFLLATSRLQSKLNELARSDALTGAMNRRALMERLEDAVALARRTSQPVALVMVDLDHFKQINDTHGHREGDRVLVDFVALVKRSTRPQDLLARMGGEEFALVLPNTTTEGALHLTQRLHAQLNLPRADGLPAYTASFGIGVWQGGGTHAGSSIFPVEAVDDWFRRADEAMYRAKLSGRNRIECAPQSAATNA